MSTNNPIQNDVYIGAKYVPTYEEAYNPANYYQPLTMVKSGNNWYVSKRPVPPNIELTNTLYWAEYFNADEMVGDMGELREEVAANTSSIDALATANTQLTQQIETLSNTVTNLESDTKIEIIFHRPVTAANITSYEDLITYQPENSIAWDNTTLNTPIFCLFFVNRAEEKILTSSEVNSDLSGYAWSIASQNYAGTTKNSGPQTSKSWASNSLYLNVSFTSTVDVVKSIWALYTLDYPRMNASVTIPIRFNITPYANFTGFKYGNALRPSLADIYIYKPTIPEVNAGNTGLGSVLCILHLFVNGQVIAIEDIEWSGKLLYNNTSYNVQFYFDSTGNNPSYVYNMVVYGPQPATAGNYSTLLAIAHYDAQDYYLFLPIKAK